MQCQNRRRPFCNKSKLSLPPSFHSPVMSTRCNPCCFLAKRNRRSIQSLQMFVTRTLTWDRATKGLHIEQVEMQTHREASVPCLHYALRSSVQLLHFGEIEIEKAGRLGCLKAHIHSLLARQAFQTLDKHPDHSLPFQVWSWFRKGYANTYF